MHTEPYRITIQDMARIFRTQHGDVPAIENINLKIKDGEFFSIVGPSGCGKTTLLRILAGLETASTGSLAIHSSQTNRPLSSMVFQEQSVFPWMTRKEKQNRLNTLKDDRNGSIRGLELSDLANEMGFEMVFQKSTKNKKHPRRRLIR